MAEKFTGANGGEIDSQGVPWVESHPVPVLRRLTFMQWLLRRTPNKTEPQEPLPQAPKSPFLSQLQMRYRKLKEIRELTIL